MNEFERAKSDCHRSIKACQSLKASANSFERLCELVDSEDHMLISSVFHMAVIKYVKPFLNNDTKDGKVRFPIKDLKKNVNFSISIHEHLIKIRNTLIAHDDFEEVAPKILLPGITLSGTDLSIPISVVISNKSISHPAHLEAAEKFRKQAQAAFDGANSVLFEDISRLRQIAIAKPEQAENAAKYVNPEYAGTQLIPKNGSRLTVPDFTNDEWLNVVVPDFSEVHNGFVYEEVRVKRDFHGPERITLANGYAIEFAPN